MRLLAGRKSCRDFLQPSGRFWVPKSSLDGARETVLIDNAGVKYPRECDRLRLQGDEQLDVVGLVKRLGGGQRSYPSISRVAVDPWLCGLEKSHPDLFEELFHLSKELHELSKELHKPDIISRFDVSRHPQYQSFPFEGAFIYESRLAEIGEEAGLKESESLKTGLPELKKLKELLHRIYRTWGEPDPYVAVLLVDGDRIGAAISRQKTPEDIRKFSKYLSQFAAEAKRIVEDPVEVRGVLIYSGGDDVLALVPVDKCLNCARKLHDQFAALLADYQSPESPLSLSVGIAIGHMIEPMEDLLAFAREAEKAAKKTSPGRPNIPPYAERNGLAVWVHPRGGVPVGVREQWLDRLSADSLTDPASSQEQEAKSQKVGSSSHGNLRVSASLDQRLMWWADLFMARVLPTKLPYDLHELARELSDWKDKNLLKQAIPAEARRIFRRKETQFGRAGNCNWLNEAQARAFVDRRLSHLEDLNDLRGLADEMLVALQFVTPLKQTLSRAER